MSLFLPAVFGAVAGLGFLVAVLGWLGAIDPGPSLSGRIRRRLDRVEQLNLRVGLAVLAAVAMAVATGWIVGVIMAALGAATAPTLVGAKRKRDALVELTEALATWAEQLRDTISSASGLREAISATSEVAPAAIAAPVRELEVRLRSESFAPAIRRFAEGMADPTADKIAVALLIASERRGQRLTDVLSEVARAAREHAEMQLRMEAARTRTYTQALTVTTVLVTMFGLMVLLSRDYLAAYDTFQGQVVLFVVMSGWGAAFVGLVKMSRVRQPERVLNAEANVDGSGRDADHSGGSEPDLGLGVKR